MQAIDFSLSETLSSHDRQLTELFQDLLADLHASRGICSCSVARWNDLEGRLLDRLEAEETFALPMFGCAHPEEAGEIHEDNAKIRYLLADMRQWVTASVLRADEVKGLLTLLVAAMNRKRATLYPWTDGLDDALASMLVHRLSESTRDPLPDFPATAHP
jgi:hypothetical protein